jgi:hypothetical protein
MCIDDGGEWTPIEMVLHQIQGLMRMAVVTSVDQNRLVLID